VADTEVRYFEDYAAGASFDCGSVAVDAAAIIAFAERYDPQPFHLDPDNSGPFGGLIASGWHTGSLVMRQLVAGYLSAESSLGAAGLDELRWLRPLRPGDTLRVRVTVEEARRSQSKPDRGIVRARVEAINQDDGPVITFTAINFIRTRPGTGSPPERDAR
jgi:acyl dehydratase